MEGGSPLGVVICEAYGRGALCAEGRHWFAAVAM